MRGVGGGEGVVGWEGLLLSVCLDFLFFSLPSLVLALRCYSLCQSIDRIESDNTRSNLYFFFLFEADSAL